MDTINLSINIQHTVNNIIMILNPVTKTLENFIIIQII